MWMLSVLLCASVLKVLYCQDIIINITQGNLKGIKSTTVLNAKPYFSFKGIPYAKPPIKFDAPVSPDSWTGVLDATQHRSTCAFFCIIKKRVVGGEDCLYLNVYTPNINISTKGAVMVFFHPGGFNSGSGDDDIYGPDFLIEQDIVVVTFNSRIGVAGFLSTEDENAPGNAGLKDQVMVLNWIKDNIVNFGGCPNKVTLFGMSSGSAAVQFHMLSPLSRDLFRGAIMQSGSALNTFAMEYNPKAIAIRLGEILGIKGTNTKELVNKLKEYSIQELIIATAEITKSLNHMNGHMTPFVPVIEPDVGKGIFLNKDPWTSIKNNDIADVPIMIGINLNETAFMASLFLSNAELMNQNFDFFLPDDLNVTNAKKKQISATVKKFYFDGKPLTADSETPFTMMTSDIFFNSGILMSSKIIGNRNKSPIYQYLFSYEAPFGPIKSLFNVTKGVAHGDELGYLFYGKYFNNTPKLGLINEKMIKILTKLWANFAKQMNPTPILDDDITIMWTSMGIDGNYLNINLPMKMEQHLFQKRINFWAEIYNNKLETIYGDLPKREICQKD